MDIIIIFVILIFSAIVHEVSHGLMAERLGDSTARNAGRITLNPVPHIDPFGSVLLPLLLLLAHSPVIFGAAKPVPVNFNNLRRPKSGMILVALAGPLSNFLMAIIFGLLLKYNIFVNNVSGPILVQAIVINLVLGTFNLIPIPPLDGSKVLAGMAPDFFMDKILQMEKFGFLLVLLFLMLGILDKILLPVIKLYGKVFGLDFGF